MKKSIFLSILLLVGLAVFALPGYASEAPATGAGGATMSLESAEPVAPEAEVAEASAAGLDASGVAPKPFWTTTNQFESCPYTCEECYAACVTPACYDFCRYGICKYCP
ncbi:MAG: hypothetical protein AAFY88_01260 [Acidobacteriota bacterium]